MPTTWHYIGGCPFATECCRQLTQRKNKKIAFSGRTAEEAQEKCAHHLILSSLHLKTKRVAWEAALAQEVHTYEDDTDEEPDDVEECERPTKRPRLAGGGDDEGADASDPLVVEISSQVSKLVGKNIAAASSAAASSSVVSLRPTAKAAIPWRSLREFKETISEAEQAARKAQDIAMKAAQAFGEVAAKLNRHYHNLDCRD